MASNRGFSFSLEAKTDGTVKFNFQQAPAQTLTTEELYRDPRVNFVITNELMTEKKALALFPNKVALVAHMMEQRCRRIANGNPLMLDGMKDNKEMILRDATLSLQHYGFPQSAQGLAQAIEQFFEALKQQAIAAAQAQHYPAIANGP